MSLPESRLADWAYGSDWHPSSAESEATTTAAGYAETSIESLSESEANAMTDASEVTKTSGSKDVFDTGYQRDARAGKGRYDLLPLNALAELAKLYERGAVHYGDRNFAKGCPFSRVYDSALRHLMKWGAGHRDESHLVAAAWNILQLIEYQADIAASRIPADLDDMTPRSYADAIVYARKTLADKINAQA